MTESIRRALGFEVSRETLDRLSTFEHLLGKWNKAINLVAPSTLAEASTRHIADSAQILRCAETPAEWIDLGSGAGLPGLIIAIISDGEALGHNVTLVESDIRKAAFLREAARATGVKITIENRRAETLSPASYDVVSARALAPISRLLEYAEPLMADNGIGLFLKGGRHAAEVDEASKRWHFTHETIPSVLDGDGVIVKVRKPRRVRNR